jgi:NADH-quinone oxidoreductase subunit A
MAEYSFFIILFMALISLPLLMILTSKIVRFIIGSKKNVSDTIYECGEPSIEGSWKRIPIAYFKIALIFILFDIELVFIFPWIITLDNPTQLSYLSFITFLIILFIGWIYAYKKGYLDWEM